jgi:hypothetical protein
MEPEGSFHCRVHNSPPLVSILSQMHLLTLISYDFENNRYCTFFHLKWAPVITA